MTAITGKEPPHWHDRRGQHRMTDPRILGENYPERWWDADERAYVTHLQTHETEHTDPQRSVGDSPSIRALFDLLEARERECQKTRELITAQRSLEEAKRNIF